MSVKIQKPSNYRPLLQTANAKTSKGELLGYITGILYLSPANESGRVNLCPFATAGCKADCLYTAGRGIFAEIRNARMAKTNYFIEHRADFLNSLRYDIAALVRKAKRTNMIPAVRINGTSDQPWIALQMSAEFPNVQFYDYTKLPHAWTRTRSNYHLTFSHSELNDSECLNALQHGINVAVVFDTRKGKELPATWNGYKVIDGDKHDLRFLDESGVIVGLRAKGEARKDATSGFVVKAIAAAA